MKFGKNPDNSFRGVFRRKTLEKHGRTIGWTHERHNAMTIARLPSASGAKNQVYSSLASGVDITPDTKFYL